MVYTGSNLGGDQWPLKQQKIKNNILCAVVPWHFTKQRVKHGVCSIVWLLWAHIQNTVLVSHGLKGAYRCLSLRNILEQVPGFDIYIFKLVTSGYHTFINNNLQTICIIQFYSNVQKLDINNTLYYVIKQWKLICLNKGRGTTGDKDHNKSTKQVILTLRIN